VLNNGYHEIKSWKVFIGFQHKEILVSTSNVVIADGTTLSAVVGNGTVFSGFPQTDLKTAIATAGDMTQIQAQVSFVGTVFGVKPPHVPLSMMDSSVINPLLKVATIFSLPVFLFLKLFDRLKFGLKFA